MKILRCFRTALLAGLLLFTASARADLFVALFNGLDSSQRVFGTLNLGTGQFTQISNPTVLFTSLTAGPGGTLFGSAFDSNFYSISASGVIAPVGPAGAAAGLYGLAYSGSGYSATQLSGGTINLYNFPSDLSTAGSFVGQIAPTYGNLTSGTLAYGPGGNLYFAFNPTPGNPPPAYLYQVNPATGAITQIGTTGLGVNPLLLAFDGTTLYGFSSATDRSYYTIDTTTGTATLAGAVTGLPTNNYVMHSAAFAIPEPGTIGLLCLGGIALAVRRRFRK